jgi:hypothetical protein
MTTLKSLGTAKRLYNSNESLIERTNLSRNFELGVSPHTDIINIGISEKKAIKDTYVITSAANHDRFKM